jgi:hypothetical protein
VNLSRGFSSGQCKKFTLAVMHLIVQAIGSNDMTYGRRQVLWPTETNSQTKQGVCHTVALPFTLKFILRQKKNYENSNILPCKNIIFKKSSKRNQNPSRYHKSLTNLKFQHKPKYHLSKTFRKNRATT